jgi:DNA-binding response OmpR family regulator
MERAKIAASDSVLETKYNNNILIIEQDEAMTLLLSTILNIQGYEIKISNSFKEIDADYIPAVIILDAGKDENKNGINMCKIIKASHIYKNTKLIVTSIYHDKEAILKAGADLYIPKPYDVKGLVKWVEDFIEEVNF